MAEPSLSSQVAAHDAFPHKLEPASLLPLTSGAQPSKSVEQHPPNVSAEATIPKLEQRRRQNLLEGIVVRFVRICRLLLVGYSTEVSQKRCLPFSYWAARYERASDWHHFHTTLRKKLENIGIVSGLLLASNVNLLCAGPTRRMTYTTILASIYLSLLSIVFGLLCLWSLVGVHPTRMKQLVTNNLLFYYLYATPSMFGGMSALSFFVAVGAWTFQEAGQGWAGKAPSIVLSVALMGNAAVCFVLGASTWDHDSLESHSKQKTKQSDMEEVMDGENNAMNSDDAVTDGPRSSSPAQMVVIEMD